MSETRANYNEEFKRNAVKLSYTSPRTAMQVSEALGIGEICCTDGGRNEVRLTSRLAI